MGILALGEQVARVGELIADCDGANAVGSGEPADIGNARRTRQIQFVQLLALGDSEGTGAGDRNNAIENHAIGEDRCGRAADQVHGERAGATEGSIEVREQDAGSAAT